MSDCPRQIDDGSEIMDDLIGVYRETSDALRATHNYIDANSNFWAGVGLLMLCAKGVYDFAKSKTLEALTTTQDAVSTTREYLDGYREDLWENEKRVIDDLGELGVVCEQIVVVEIQISNGGGSTGGSTGGSSSAGAGAGGFSMPSSPTPTAPTPPTPTTDPTDGPDIHVDVTVDGDGNVKVNVDGDGNEDVDVTVKVEGDGDVDVTVDGEAVDATGGDATADTGDDATAGTAGGGAGGGSDGATDDSDTGASGDGSPVLEDGSAPPASPEQQAKEAAFYDRMWKEQAAHDPLGRSAGELRLAWEEREPLVFDDSLVHAGAGIGYGDARPAFPASFHIDAQKASAA